MRPELNSMRLNFANRRQAEDLKPATIRQNGQVPIDETMQPTRPANDFHSRTNVKVISIPENDLRAHFAQFTRINRFDTPLRAHGHKHRRVYNPVRHCKTAKP